MRRTIAALACLGVALLPAQAAAQNLPCLGPPQVEALADYMLGPAATALANGCGTQFAAVSPTIVARRGELATRFADEGEAAWPVLKAAIMEASGPGIDNIKRQLEANETGVRAIASAVVAQTVAGELDARKCANADALLAALLPLTDAQIGNIAAAFVRIGIASSTASPLGGLRLCEAAPR